MMRLKDLKSGMLLKLKGKSRYYMVMFDKNDNMVFTDEEGVHTTIGEQDERHVKDVDIERVYDRPVYNFQLIGFSTKSRDQLWRRQDRYIITSKDTGRALLWDGVAYYTSDTYDDTVKSLFTKEECDSVLTGIMTDLFEAVKQ